MQKVFALSLWKKAGSGGLHSYFVFMRLCTRSTFTYVSVQIMLSHAVSGWLEAAARLWFEINYADSRKKCVFWTSWSFLSEWAYQNLNEICIVFYVLFTSLVNPKIPSDQNVYMLWWIISTSKLHSTIKRRVFM